MQYFRDILYSVSATNALDMLIIACLIYFILKWFRGTRAWQILATLGGLGVFYLASSRLGLVLTSVLFQYLSAAIIIVLVIVFQPEIREMLERASPIRYLSGGRPHVVQPDVIEETVKAVVEMTRLRMGALIVFQRSDRLRNILLKGREFDGLVSAETLLMIFQKGSPLHDGAVLIKDDRIKAASCILPLSSEEGLSSRYGTRHRAAVGLTEHSDALCVVVSEERGEVSIVTGREITNYRKKTDFHLALERELVSVGNSREGSSAGLKGLFLANARLKLLAMCSAVALWLVFVGPQSSEVGITVPIQYTNPPPGMEITGKWMDRIDVRARGSEASLANLKPESIRAVVDLSGAVTGLNFFRISSKNLQVPPGVTIAQIRPSDLHLRIEATAGVKFKVVPSVTGVIPEKARIVVNPVEVQVKGLENDLKQVQSVVTEPVKVSELLEKGPRKVPVSVQPEGLRIDWMDPMQVTVSIERSDP
ncbi:MAG: diadenylate cyclase CdaA [Desulfomonile sp.]|nr:diadenylate cyclase CdaA [Desulfomonile sp.]